MKKSMSKSKISLCIFILIATMLSFSNVFANNEPSPYGYASCPRCGFSISSTKYEKAFEVGKAPCINNIPGVRDTIYDHYDIYEYDCYKSTCSWSSTEKVIRMQGSIVCGHVGVM